MAVKSTKLTVSINPALKNEFKKKILDYHELYLKDMVLAGLLLVKDKNEQQIRNIIKKYSSKEVKQ